MNNNNDIKKGVEPPVKDHGPEPYIFNVAAAANRNTAYRAAVWTGKKLQMTLMSIPVRGEIGLEMHPDTDQYIRVEGGAGLVRFGRAKDRLDAGRRVIAGDGIFVPMGTWHNVINVGAQPLSLSSVYGPPQHPRGTYQPVKPVE